jgi:hypothetical protein
MLAPAVRRHPRENSGESSTPKAKLSQAKARKYDACEGCTIATEGSFLFSLFLARLEHREERLLRDVHLAN